MHRSTACRRGSRCVCGTAPLAVVNGRGMAHCAVCMYEPCLRLQLFVVQSYCRDGFDSGQAGSAQQCVALLIRCTTIDVNLTDVEWLSSTAWLTRLAALATSPSSNAHPAPVRRAAWNGFLLMARLVLRRISEAEVAAMQSHFVTAVENLSRYFQHAVLHLQERNPILGVQARCC